MLSLTVLPRDIFGCGYARRVEGLAGVEIRSGGPASDAGQSSRLEAGWWGCHGAISMFSTVPAPRSTSASSMGNQQHQDYKSRENSTGEAQKHVGRCSLVG